MPENSFVWKNSATLSLEIEPWTGEKFERLVELRNLSHIASAILWPNNQSIINEISENIVLSEHAKDIIDEVPDLQTMSRPVTSLAFFMSFYHLDIFLDTEKMDESKIKNIISRLLKDGTVKIPSRFGRFLYDKYNKDFNLPRADHLSVEDTDLLLNGSQQGVYQYGYNLVGPLGILNARAARRSRASRQIPLWHCDNIGCNHLHEVALSDYSAVLRQAVTLIDSHAENTMGPPSHWDAVIAAFKDDLVDDSFGDIFIFVQEQFSKKEKCLILLELLNNSLCKILIWEEIKKFYKKKDYSKPKSDFIGSLYDEHLSQLILINSNEDIITAVDALIKRGEIVVPSTEVRVAKTRLSGSEATCAVSSLGLRSSEENPIVRMAAAIWFAYDEADNLTELSWRAVKAAGPATPGTVLQYLNNKSPREAVVDLILCSSDITQYVKDLLIFELYDDEDMDYLCDRILWKFGFDVPRYGKEYHNLVRNLDVFRDELNQQSPLFNELTREKIRSSGVNLFVYLENFLELMISYNVWLFSNDHFQDKFIYEPQSAIEAVNNVIDPPEGIFWNSAGSNTLGVLLAYLSASVKWMEGLSLENNSGLNRPLSLYPHYSAEDDNLFPFHNIPFWANCDQSEFRKYVSAYSEIAAAFLRSELASVRNGLDHYRSENKFPPLETMMICEMRLRQAAFSADAKSFFPKTWWMQTRLYNATGQYEETFVDHNRREIKLSYPTILKAIKEVTFGVPAIIPHGNLLGQANSSIVFVIKEQSESSRMWSDYPYRRVVADRSEPENELIDIDKSLK